MFYYAVFCFSQEVFFFCRCNVDYTNREQLLMNEEEGLHRLCGLTLFMGELFLNYTVRKQSTSNRLLSHSADQGSYTRTSASLPLG